MDLAGGAYDATLDPLVGPPHSSPNRRFGAWVRGPSHQILVTPLKTKQRKPVVVSWLMHVCVYVRCVRSFSSAEMACAVVVTHISTLLLCIASVILHRNRRRLGLAALAGKTRHRQRRFSFPGEVCGGGGLRAAYERRLPWSGSAVRCAGGYTSDEKAVMSLDRATAAETVSFKRGDVRQYTLNDYYANHNDVR